MLHIDAKRLFIYTRNKKSALNSFVYVYVVKVI